MRSRILIGLILGAVGGLLGWLLQENLINYGASVVRDVLTGGCTMVSPSASQDRTFVFCVGGMIGLFLGMIDGIVEGNGRKLAQGLALGAVSGVLLGFIGYNLGQLIYGFLGTGGHDPGLFSFARQVIARALGWAFLGLGLGVGAGISTRSPRRILNGAIGGFIGGMLGGFVFDMVAQVALPVRSAAGGSGCQEIGGASRAIGIPAIGALTGFFIGLVDELLKQAWVKVLAGKNEGKDFILSKAMNILGRDERCDVPLFGDPAIGGQHAAIRADGNRHVLIDAGTPLGTIVNGQRVGSGNELLLRDGDMIQIGSQRILFREKATQSRVAPSPVDTAKSKPVGGSGGVAVPAHVCPYCGSPKKADGSCLCTLGAGAGGFAPAPNPFPAPAPAFDPVFSNPAPGFSAGLSSALPSQLTGTGGAYFGQGFRLNPNAPELTVGREPGRDFLLSAEVTVSRNHARLALENGRWVVYDLGSANGTFVNGARISAQPLALGDTVQFGASQFRVE